ncbi:MAG: type II toxin-antitoxin system Phd/YefM family antitoxin [Acidobacteriota bacterium]
METVNALKVRNHLGEVLDRLEKTGQPILISKGRKIRAVLVTVEEFEKRFLDVRAAEEKQRFLEKLLTLRSRKSVQEESLTLLRSLRGYGR